MAAAMLVGVVTTLLIEEPSKEDVYPYSTADYSRFFFVFLCSVLVFVGVFIYTPSTPELASGYTQTLLAFLYKSLVLITALLTAFFTARVCLKSGLVNRELVYEGYQAPMLDFFNRYGKLALWVLLLVGFYRVSDIVMGVIANVFYIDMGYSKAQIASVTKIFGVIVTIAGSFLGGLMALRYGVMRILMLGSILVAATNLLFMWLAQSEPSMLNLTLVIVADNLAQGIAVAAFIAWLSSLTNVSFTATQYAIFSSVMTLFPKLIGGYSGTMVEAIGYSNFFLFASVLGVPIIILIYFLQDKLQVNQTSS